MSTPQHSATTLYSHDAGLGFYPLLDFPQTLLVSHAHFIRAKFLPTESRFSCLAFFTSFPSSLLASVRATPPFLFVPVWSLFPSPVLACMSFCLHFPFPSSFTSPCPPLAFRSPCHSSSLSHCRSHVGREHFLRAVLFYVTLFYFLVAGLVSQSVLLRWSWC